MALHSYTRVVIIISVIAALAALGSPVAAQDATNWWLFVGTTGHGSTLGSSLGITHDVSDGYNGDQPLAFGPNKVGIYLLGYHTQAEGWPDGLYGGEVHGTPITPGGSQTWSNLYLWAQNFTPTSANLAVVVPQDGTRYTPPAGYRGHLVLDYVPDSCNWTGPTDYWLDLTTTNQFALPIPVVTDPLQGTRFHMDVYAPVPEPSSLAALICGLMGVGGAAMRPRRK